MPATQPLVSSLKVTRGRAGTGRLGFPRAPLSCQSFVLSPLLCTRCECTPAGPGSYCLQAPLPDLLERRCCLLRPQPPPAFHWGSFTRWLFVWPVIDQSLIYHFMISVRQYSSKVITFLISCVLLDLVGLPRWR